MGVAVTELWAVGELDLVDDLVFTETISRFLFTTGAIRDLFLFSFP